MAKQLQNISTLALNRDTSADTESDYDTDDLDTTITDSKKFKSKAESRLRLASVNSNESWGDTMMSSLTEVDIERLRLHNPMSDSMMMSMTEADIDKLRLTQSMLVGPNEKLCGPDPMMDSMISDNSALVDMRRHGNDDADTDSSEGEGLRNFEDGATIKRRVSKKRKSTSKENKGVHINGDQSQKPVDGAAEATKQADNVINDSQSETCDADSKPLDITGIDVTRTSAVPETSSDNPGVSSSSADSSVKLNGAVCNGEGNED